MLRLTTTTLALGDDFRGLDSYRRLMQYLSLLEDLFATARLPVGHNLLGGQVNVVPAMEADQRPDKPQRIYMVHYTKIQLKGGGHLVVSRPLARCGSWISQ